MAKKTPIDLLDGPTLALRGRVVTMNDQFRVIPDGVVYIAQGAIIAVKEFAAPPPEGFAGVRRTSVGGTIYPGLIDLHNHLAYNALPMWMVPKRFTNRSQWGKGPEYRRLVSGPMTVVGKTPELLPAVVRYVECKNLVAGVTTSQGIELFSNAGVRRHYRGLIRNVEQTDEAELPEAGTRVADVDAASREGFLARLKKRRCFLLHLSEGIDDAARTHFEALRFPQGEWAIHQSLCGIHCAALRAEHFDIMGSRKASMVWSPMSNLLLYGQTADVRAARDGGVRIGLGADWSPSGSKNLLGELKVAKAANELSGEPFNDRQLVAMATREAAAILGWEKLLGSLEQGKRADLICVAGRSADPYAQLLAAKETSMRLVLINGVPRFGTNALMKAVGAAGAGAELVRIGGQQRTLQLEQRTADPVVGAISLAEAVETMTRSFAQLAELAKALETGVPMASIATLARVVEPSRLRRAAAARRAGAVTWSLALDEIEETGAALRPRVPVRRGGPPTGPEIADLMAAAAEPLSQLLRPMAIDPLTAVDDSGWIDRLKAQRNLPAEIRSRLVELFG